MASVANITPSYLGGSVVTPGQLSERQTAAARQISAVAVSPGSQVASYAVLAPDAKMVNGKTYTIQFASDTAITPDILTSAVTDAGLALQSPTASGPDANSNYTVTFTYEGDGTDTVSQYANAIQAEVLAETSQPSGGNPALLSFIIAFTPTGGIVSDALSPVISQQVKASNVDQIVLATQANIAGAAQDTAKLTGGLLLVGIIVVGILLFAPSILKATQPRVSVG